MSQISPEALPQLYPLNVHENVKNIIVVPCLLWGLGEHDPAISENPQIGIK